MHHFLNTQAHDLSHARVASLLNPKTIKPFPTLLLGSNTLHEFFAHSNGTIVEPGTSTLRVTIADAMGAPAAGVFTITGDESAVVDALTTAEDLASALNTIPSIAADGGVNVSGAWPSFLIAYREVGTPTGFSASAALLSPDTTADLAVLTAGSGGVRELVRLTLRTSPLLLTEDFTVISEPYAGWQGRLPLTSAAALSFLQIKGQAFGEYVQAHSLITVDVIDVSGNVTPIYQAGVVIRASNYDLAAQEQNFLMSTYFTAAPSVTGLVSAVANAVKLGGLATVGVFNTGTTLRLTFTGDVVADYRLTASTASESHPFLIRPYDYHASTNARQWALVQVLKVAAPCVWNPDTSKFHFTGGDGAANAVALEVDQTGFALPA